MVCVCDIVLPDLPPLMIYDTLEFFEYALEAIQQEVKEEDDLPW